MSKAFTRETDNAPQDLPPAPRDPLPAGAKNYVTPAGAHALHSELRRLEDRLRPPTAEDSDASLGQERQALERRMQFLRQRIAEMIVVDPRTQDPRRVQFGATVTVADEQGTEATYRIVGIDEADPACGKVSWLAPVAKALLSAQVGSVVNVQRPRGNTELEVLKIDYE